MPKENNTLDDTLDRALEMIALKDVRRTGWVLRGVHRPESVADHSWGTAFLSLVFLREAEQTEGALDHATVLAIATVHDLAEVRTGDIPRRVDPARQPQAGTKKAEAERRALTELVGSLPSLAGLLELWEEYEAAETGEARYVRDMNLVDMCLQALSYEIDRRYDPSDGAEEFPEYPRMEEFFATAGPRFCTAVGRQIYDRLWERYRRVVGQDSGKNTS